MNRLNLISRGLRAFFSLRSYEDFRTFYNKLSNLALRRYDNYYGTKDKPHVLQIEPTNYCNLSCVCCSASRSSRKKGCMNFDLFKKIIEDASQTGVHKIDLFLHGEPLLHPQIIEMLQYIKSKNLIVEIATNAMLLTKEKSELILQSNLTPNDILRFSILGYSKTIHEKIQKGADHDKVLNNIIEFLELQTKYNSKGPSTKVSFYAIPYNKREKAQYKKFWNGKVNKVSIGKASKTFELYKIHPSMNKIRKKICTYIWTRMTTFWNGDVPVCCVDVDGDYILGNLNQQSIKEIWNSEQYAALKKLHADKQLRKFPLCTHCDFR